MSTNRTPNKDGGSNSRLHQYKTHTPPWKETYRKRCIDRFKNSRDKIQNSRRNIADSDTESIKCMMLNEWQHLREESRLDATFDDEQFGRFGDVDMVLSIFDEIERELKQEEERRLDDYERYESHFPLDDSIDAPTNQITCPVCQQHRLLANRNVILCPCGLRIDTEQDCIRLEDIGQQIQASVSDHTRECGARPEFGVVNIGTYSNLLMTCKACDFMVIIV